MNPVFKGYLRLCRPPNLPTAAADVLAGMAIAGYFAEFNIGWDGLTLIMASILLYAGGVVLNDVFDFELDKVERPERPIPSGLVSYNRALLFGFSLMALGVFLCYLIHEISFLVALLLALSIWAYDAYSKKFSFLGPLNMGICRGLNLLLGISILQDFSLWPYAFVPVVFIFAVTLISRGEVHGDNKQNILLAGCLYAAVLALVIVLHYNYAQAMGYYLPFLACFAVMVFLPLIRAYNNNVPKNIMKAVKSGVLSLILMDAAMAVAHANWKLGVAIVLLLPLSMLLAKAFAVT